MVGGQLPGLASTVRVHALAGRLCRAVSSRHTVNNLDGWTFADEDGHIYTFDHYRLAGRATVRIHTGEGRGTRSDLYQDRRHYVWHNNSDTATLRDDGDRLIDRES
ncbi:hypothetical protein RKD18_008252 [Streptomyces phaeoluteigriseus]